MLDELLISPEESIRSAMARIDANACGAVVVVDRDRRLLSTVTDGDIRRAILAGVDLDTPLSALQSSKRAHPRPITAAATSKPAEILKLMHDHRIRQIPLLDEGGRVVGLETLDNLVPDATPPLRAVIMAGGLGTRLRPLTEELPKSMLPVGGRPVMERILEQLVRSGVRRVSVATHYRAEKIREHFGDGQSYGIELSYLDEAEPLGTAGALHLLEAPVEPFLVINGDILTQVNFRAMTDYHREHRADMTVAVRSYEVHVPFGVVESEDGLVQRVSEKPRIEFFVNAGIYLLEPRAWSLIPSGERFDMTDLIQRLVADGRTVASFPISEYWIDMGEHDSYTRAQDDFEAGSLAPAE